MRPRATGLAFALALALLAAPLATDAQQVGKVPRIGLLRLQPSSDPLVGLIRQALREVGYVEGQTIAFEYRSAEGRSERLPALAADMVRLKVDAILAGGDQAIRAAQQATPRFLSTSALWRQARCALHGAGSVCLEYNGSPSSAQQQRRNEVSG